MTVERKIVVGLEDVKAVSLKCRSCSLRITISPDRPRLPNECPACQSSWLSLERYNANVIEALANVRKPTTGSPTFHVLLEFDEAELAGRL